MQVLNVRNVRTVDKFLKTMYFCSTFMKKTKTSKQTLAPKAETESLKFRPITNAKTPSAVSGPAFDPEREEIAYDDHGEPYLRSTPQGMLEDAHAEVNQRELDEYHETISLLRDKGFSFRDIADFLSKRGVPADHNAVYRVYTKHMTPEEAAEAEVREQEEQEQAREERFNEESSR